MPQIDNATSILNTIRADLKREKEALVLVLKDPKIADWNSINLKQHGALLDAAGIDPERLIASLSGYQQQAKKIAKQIVEWNNEVGNQLADCIDCRDPDAALSAAHKLETKVRGITAMAAELQEILRPLRAADESLRHLLTLDSLIQTTKLLVPGKKDLIAVGATILSLLTGDRNNKSGEPTLLDLRQEPERLEARFRRLDITNLPRLVEEILFHHVEEALAANREVKTFLDSMLERMEHEISMISTIGQDLAALQAEPLARLVKGIIAQCQVMANLLSALYHKRQIKNTMDAVNGALDSINGIYSILKNRIIPALQKEVERSGSPINPTSVTARMTRGFFEGASGIIRSLKLMMTSLKGHGSINEIELQLLLERGVTNCKIYYGKSRSDLKQITHYLDSLVNRYPKPFPYNDLFHLARNTLSAYGEAVEKFIADYEIPKDIAAKLSPPPAKVGELYEAVKKHKISFQKANAEL